MSTPPRLTMYTTAICPYCIAAKNFLRKRGITDIDEVRVDFNDALRQDMMERSGRRTVPQIWWGEQHIGGYDDMVALDRAGKLPF